MAKRKRILLADDEENILFVIGESLKKFSHTYEVVTAINGLDALNIFQETAVDLVLTDLMMPEMDGLQLTEAIRAVNKDIPVVWITAFGTPELEEKAEELNVKHFLAKPLNIEDIRFIAQSALDKVVSQQAKDKDTVQLGGKEKLSKRLSQLQVETGAHMILLTTTSGNPVDMAGVTKDMDISTLSALVAANFLAAHEIARLLGKESIFKLSYHESDQHNVYAYSVSEKYLLITVFGEETKPGVVWFYAQRAVEELRNIMKEVKVDDRIDNSIAEALGQELQLELDRMFSSSADSPLVPIDQPSEAKQAQNTAELPKATPLYSFSEALAQGIIQGNVISDDEADKTEK